MILKRDNVEVTATTPEKAKALIEEGFCLIGEPKPDEQNQTNEKYNDEQVNVESEFAEKNLSDLKKDDLVSMAVNIGISGAKNLTKAELIEVLTPEEQEE